MGKGPPKYDWPTIWPDPKRLTRDWLGLILFVAAFLTVVPGLWVIVRFYGALVAGDHEVLRNIGLIFLAVIGAPFVVWRAIVAQGNLDRSRDRDYADLFTKAVEQLGADKVVKRLRPATDQELHEGSPQQIAEEITEPNIEVRLGAIYALERISQDSERDHIAVMETLCAYVRENAPATSLEPTKPPLNPTLPNVDIQAAVSVIGRRSEERRHFEWSQKFRLNLDRSDLSFADFSDGDFSAATFNHAKLEGAIFYDATLDGTRFYESQLMYSRFGGASLIGTVFDKSTIGPDVPFGFSMGKIKGISVAAADLSSIDFLASAPVVYSIFGSKDTKLGLLDEEERENALKLRNELSAAKSGSANRSVSEIESEIEENRFKHWSRLNYRDMLYPEAKNKFLREFGIEEWPYNIH